MLNLRERPPSLLVIKPHFFSRKKHSSKRVLHGNHVHTKVKTWIKIFFIFKDVFLGESILYMQKWFKVFEHWFWISSTWISEVSWMFVYLQPQSLPLGLQKRAVGQKRSIRKRPKNDLQRVSRDCSNFEFSDSILPAQFSKNVVLVNGSVLC